MLLFIYGLLPIIVFSFIAIREFKTIHRAKGKIIKFHPQRRKAA